MTSKVDSVAVAGVAVAGVIAVSSAEGRYEPLDGVVGVVLAILLYVFCWPQEGAPTRQLVAIAAVGALIGCLVVSPLVEWVLAPPLEPETSTVTFRVSVTLCLASIVFFALLLALFRPGKAPGERAPGERAPGESASSERTPGGKAPGGKADHTETATSPPPAG